VAKTPEIGQIPPDFTLPGIELAGGDVTKREYTLSQQRGQPIVLAFYPGDNTPVCKKQFCSYRDRAEDFGALNATVVGISSQDLASHEDFIGKNNLTVPRLADVDKTVAESYSAAGRTGVKRAVIVIDEQGIVRHRHDHLLGLDFQTVDDLKAALDTLPGATG